MQQTSHNHRRDMPRISHQERRQRRRRRDMLRTSHKYNPRRGKRQHKDPEDRNKGCGARQDPHQGRGRWNPP